MFYPQINEKCLVQYPVKKVLKARTITTETIEGNRAKLTDVGGATYEWLLSYRGLTREEALELKGFFSSTEGSLKPFSFIDPVGNILRFSEALSTSPWNADVGLTISSGLSDPFTGAGSSVLVNSTGMPAALRQTCPVPSQYTYCLSFWAKGSGEPIISAGWTAGSSSVLKTIRCSEEWKRYQISGRSNRAGDATTFWVELSAGARVEIAGLQAEAQLEASGYRRTYAESGVFDEAHFVDDDLSVIAMARGEYSIDTKVESQWKEIGS
ncbi:MAG: hypothetical protein IT168_02585 [Bryobacterales bacterium]|nr:hypothetical protein [Bryobacterales bacterium]